MDLFSHEAETPIPIASRIHDSPPFQPSKDLPPPQHQQHSIVPYTGRIGCLVVKYMECLKNHAAPIGGIARDGCGEFMPDGEGGTLDALKCSACGCHRNFHRKEVDSEPPMVMPLGALQASAPKVMKKRFRTKFTAEQKERMLEFAERVGWRMQGQEEGVVQQFCQEIRVKRRVLKVWMHNNKHSLAKRSSSTTQLLE